MPTDGEQRLAASPLRARLARAALATVAMLAVIVGAFVLGERIPPLTLGVLSDAAGRGLTVQVALLATALALTAALAGFANIGLSRRGAVTSLVLAAPLLAVSIIDARLAIPSAAFAAVALVFGLLVALTEEIYARGLLITVLGGRTHVVLALLGSSALFAYLHLPVYVSVGGWTYALVRCTGSAAFSIVAAIIRLRSGSIVGLITFHTLNDAQFLLSATAGPTATPVANVAPILVGGGLALVYWLACRRGIERSR